MDQGPGGQVPPIRVVAANPAPPRPDGGFVLYWMSASRRTEDSFGLQRAVDWAVHLGRPLVVLEALRAGYPFASDRLHRFVLDGMGQNAQACARAGVAYRAWVEPAPGAGAGLLAALASRACVVVADEFPTFFLPRAVSAAARQSPVRFETVDGLGLLPLRAAFGGFPTAFAFRRFLQRELPAHLGDFPQRVPLARAAGLPRLSGWPADLDARWPRPDPALLEGSVAALARLPIDHSVAPSPIRGGPDGALAALGRFVAGHLGAYAERHGHPDDDATSGLSPYLHFGHVSPHRVLQAVAAAEGWDRGRVSRKASGRREGWWGMSPGAEAFLDQVVTWRELGGLAAFHRHGDHDRYEGLPGWARATLEAHARDPRPVVYPLEALEAAETTDPVWNAAQRQLRSEGRIHNHPRMIWGKRILEWTRCPEDAFATLVYLNDRWALDGRDPNSYSGISWCLGRYDRPWGPERPIFGTVRYMSSALLPRKARARRWLERWGDPASRPGG